MSHLDAQSLHRLTWRDGVIGASSVAFFLLPYFLTILPKFFVYDTIVLLYHYGRLPLNDLKGFLSPQVIFFWRPLPAWLLAVEYRLFGLQPEFYHVVDLTLHAMVGVLFFVFVHRLVADKPLAAAACALFLANWQYCETVFWIANGATLLSAVSLLVMMLSFDRWLADGRWRWGAVLSAATLMGMLSKETIISAPAFLVLIWLWRGGAGWLARWGKAGNENGETAFTGGMKRGAMTIFVQTGALLLYALAHARLIRNTYPLSINYQPSSWWQWPVNLSMALNHLALPFVDHALIINLPLNNLLLKLRYLYPVVPFILIVWAVWKGDRLMGLGLTMAAAGLFPIILTADYNASRHYYVPSMGMALVWLRVFSIFFEEARRAPVQWMEKSLRVVGSVLVGAFLLLNISQTYLQSEAATLQSQYGRRLFQFLASHRGEWPAGSLLVVSDPSINRFWGWRELAKFALKDDDAELVFGHQPLPEAFIVILRSRPRARIDIIPDRSGGFQSVGIESPAGEVKRPLSAIHAAVNRQIR